MRFRPSSSSARPRPGFSWPVVLAALLIGAAVFLGWWQRQEQARAAQIVALVKGTPVTRTELAEALRNYLWVRGLSWDALDEAGQKKQRREALDGLVEARLLRSWAESQRPGGHAGPSATNGAFQQFLKQFEETGGWVERAAWQGMNEAALQEWLDSETLVREVVEARFVASMPPVTDAEARQWFETRPSGLEVPERARVDHLFLGGHDQNKPDRELEMRELHRQILAGEATLSGLASRLSEDPRSNKTGGSLGWLTRDRVPAEFAEKVFSLSRGQLSEPFRTPLGWHVVFVHEKLPPRPVVYDEAKEEVMALLRTRRRAEAARALRAELLRDAAIQVFDDHLSGVAPLP